MKPTLIDYVFYSITFITIILCGLYFAHFTLFPTTKTIYVYTFENCTDQIVEAIDYAFPYNATSNFTCLDRAKKASEILSFVGFHPEIKMGLEEINGTQRGHAWFTVDGKDYWKGDYNWSIPYTDENVNYYMTQK
jgi:hypothetical protein